MYQIEFTKGATKQLNKLPHNIKERIDAKILDLAIEPRPNGVKKLKGDENTYRIRVSDYRVARNDCVDAEYYVGFEMKKNLRENIVILNKWKN